MRKTFQKWLLLFVVCAFTLALTATYVLQTRQTKDNALSMISLRLEDAHYQVQRNEENLSILIERNKTELLSRAKSLAQILKEGGSENLNTDYMRSLLDKLDVDEINIIDEKGIIIATSEERFLGFDMDSSEQSRVFMPILKDPSLEIVQEPRRIGYDDQTEMQYAAVYRSDAPGLIQVGYLPYHLQEAKELAAIDILTAGFRIGREGYVVVVKEGEIISSINEKDLGKRIVDLGITAEMLNAESFRASFVGKEYLCQALSFADFLIIGKLPLNEVYADRNTMMLLFVVCYIILFAAIFALISSLVQKVVISGIEDVNKSLSKITNGDLNEKVAVQSCQEFVSLSTGINSTVEALKEAIAAAAARIDKELEFAKAIQLTSMPGVFPPYPHLEQFSIFASMDTAREVGGDFYDFFLIGSKKLGLVIADVSGKGIPAALYMMTAKTHIKNSLFTSKNLSEAMSKVNNYLCENNDAGMFVTVFVAVYDFADTRELSFVNAGHNLPLIFKKDKSYEWLKGKRNFVLGGMENYKFKEDSILLEPGDKILFYTDGITEAQKIDGELFSDERLLNLMNSPEVCTASVEEQLLLIKRAVDEFVEEAEQFDDMTMLAIEIKATLEDNLRTLTVPAVVEQIPVITDFVNEILEENACPPKAQMQIDIAIDEIFSNIAFYAYGQNGGEVTIECGIFAAEAFLRFSDYGKPYNPLEREDPDVTLPAEERNPGGLGIFMVKKSMDEVGYEYRDGKNILTLKKKCT